MTELDVGGLWNARASIDATPAISINVFLDDRQAEIVPNFSNRAITPSKVMVAHTNSSGNIDPCG